MSVLQPDNFETGQPPAATHLDFPKRPRQTATLARRRAAVYTDAGGRTNSNSFSTHNSPPKSPGKSLAAQSNCKFHVKLAGVTGSNTV